MRSIETILRENPELTGKEILALQEQDKIADEKEYQEAHKEKLEFINDINENGGFYKGRFGTSQLYYYSFSNLQLGVEGTITCDVKTILVFNRPNENFKTFSVEISTKEYVHFDSYGIGHGSMYTRVTKEDFQKVEEYFIKGAGIFWD